MDSRSKLGFHLISKIQIYQKLGAPAPNKCTPNSSLRSLDFCSSLWPSLVPKKKNWILEINICKQSPTSRYSKSFSFPVTSTLAQSLEYDRAKEPSLLRYSSGLSNVQAVCEYVINCNSCRNTTTMLR